MLMPSLHIIRVASKLISPNIYRISRRFADLKKKMEPPKALVFLAPGVEEIELTVTVDVLRRAGIKVYMVGVKDKLPVKCSRDVIIMPDISILHTEHYGPYDAMILPGGQNGANVMSASEKVGKLLKEQEKAGKIVAAICAAPTSLKNHSIYLGKSITCFPRVEKIMTEGGEYKLKQGNVVVDGPLITSRGPGTAFEFAFTIVEKLVGKEVASKVANDLLLKY